MAAILDKEKNVPIYFFVNKYTYKGKTTFKSNDGWTNGQ